MLSNFNYTQTDSIAYSLISCCQR